MVINIWPYIYGHIYPYMAIYGHMYGHIWPYMTIYMTIYGHIWPYMVITYTVPSLANLFASGDKRSKIGRRALFCSSRHSSKVFWKKEWWEVIEISCRLHMA